jgi:hypothetical protein
MLLLILSEIKKKMKTISHPLRLISTTRLEFSYISLFWPLGWKKLSNEDADNKKKSGGE